MMSYTTKVSSYIKKHNKSVCTVYEPLHACSKPLIYVCKIGLRVFGEIKRSEYGWTLYYIGFDRI